MTLTQCGNFRVINGILQAQTKNKRFAVTITNLKYM